MDPARDDARTRADSRRASTGRVSDRPPARPRSGLADRSPVRTTLALPTPLAARAYISALDLFRVGIGPSSSHTVGPLRAARAFVQQLQASPHGLDAVAHVECDLFGSLGATGIGHGTPGAVLAGLSGCVVESVTKDDVERVVADAGEGMLTLGGTHPIALAPEWLRFAPHERRVRHPNALELRAFGADGEVLARDTYYSVGGGFVEHEGGDHEWLNRGEQRRHGRCRWRALPL